MTRTVAGIDVGANSVGVALWELDDDGTPVALLNAQTFLHDGGVHRGLEKAATSRLEAAGIARRTRRRYRRRKLRLEELDSVLASNGFQVATQPPKDPRAPWLYRAALAGGFIADPDRRALMIAESVRHIARHRGWRNPYQRVEALRGYTAPSEPFEKMADLLGVSPNNSDGEIMTVGQIVAEAIAEKSGLPAGPKLRGPSGAMVARLLQSDLANELHTIFEVQQVDPDTAWAIEQAVFAAESPRGSAEGRVGKDPLPGQRAHPRSSKSSPAFQEFRIRATIANLRISEAGTEHPLDKDQRRIVADWLLAWSDSESPTWGMVAELLGIPRRSLMGTANAGPDGEPATRPPTDRTNHLMSRCSVGAVREWWRDANEADRTAFTELIAGSRQTEASSEEQAEVDELFASLTPEELIKLEALDLPRGRAAYSVNSLRRLNARLSSSELDLHAALQAEFGVDNDWRPPVDPIGATIGNPAVDRVTRIVGRWLEQVGRRWGAPERVVIEHVRDAFVSVARAREMEREAESRRRKREAARQRFAAETGTPTDQVRDEQVRRFLIVERQDATCVYCGAGITYASSQLDHIRPRRGKSSRSTQDNLVAVCVSCNLSKSNTPFAVWAERSTNPNISVKDAVKRVKAWRHLSDLPNPAALRSLKTRVIRNIQTANYDDTDERPMESVAWMARELAARIQAHFKDETKVNVYRGSITAQARRAAGIDKAFTMIGGQGKQRLDRRHHVVDAAVVALMKPYAAQVLGERLAMRDAARYTPTADAAGWKTHEGSTPALVSEFRRWKHRMEAAVSLLQRALDEDTIIVRRPLRLTPNVGRLHEDQVASFYPKKTKKNEASAPVIRLGDELPASLIDRASTPALWHALTRHEDYDPQRGLPESSARRIRVQGRLVEAMDPLEFFPTPAAALTVRGGWVKLGDALHHARVYRFQHRGKTVYGMIRVFAIDLRGARGGDVFGFDLDPGSISMRTAETKCRNAVVNGEAEYLGWLVPGDEIQVKVPIARGSIGEFLEAFPGITRWEVTGLESPTTLKVRPLLLSKEATPADLSENATTVIQKAWRPKINVLMQMPGLKVVRRDTLGRERQESAAHLPVSWSPQAE
ncbi:type II CRISPR RNA-guided endonuclease Cas9 [Rarobacter incanus]|uniref:CRISPR-associated endonuclease Csn1 n=1 Tax=Rarobacter incanus TaxID=153494 RepID=A0A542SPU9_9MICO|nr:type II CRISPR RNA-guided endonuclease Cas9 [Rarobacter incanus]TQK76598.1 CRISPR-associated endonuclease Csn1 [Rarobacter incanus]